MDVRTVMAFSLRETFIRIAQTEANENPAYNLMLNDYINYHIVFVVGGLAYLCAILVVTFRSGKRLVDNAQGRGRSLSVFERRAFLLSSTMGTLIASIILVLVFANLSNVIAPTDGFLNSLPETVRSPTIADRPSVQEAVQSWAASGDAKMPAVLQQAVRDRLAWQQPKAIIFSILLIISIFASINLWSKILRNSDKCNNALEQKWKIRVIGGIFLIILGFILFILTIGNTEAAFAPITITVMFSG